MFQRILQLKKFMKKESKTKIIATIGPCKWKFKNTP